MLLCYVQVAYKRQLNLRCCDSIFVSRNVLLYNFVPGNKIALEMRPNFSYYAISNSIFVGKDRRRAVLSCSLKPLLWHGTHIVPALPACLSPLPVWNSDHKLLSFIAVQALHSSLKEIWIMKTL